MQVIVPGSRFHHVALNGSYCTLCQCSWQRPVGRAPKKKVCPRCIRAAKGLAIGGTHPDA